MKKILYIYVLFIPILFFGQQQTLFTNFINNQYLYNPAYAGVFKGQEYSLNYRQQWAGFSDAPRTAFATGYGTFKKRPNMAVSGIVMNDRLGLLQRTLLYAGYSYHVKLTKKVNLGFGLSVGGSQYNVKIYDAKPYPTDLDDPFLRSNILNANAFDANAGAYLYSNKFFLSISSLQFASSKINWNNSVGKLTPHSYISSGYNITLDKKKKEWVLQPSALVRFNAPSPTQLEGNLKLTYKELVWLAGAYRHKSTASLIIGTCISKQFTIAYSYDYATTALQKYSSGSHEIMLKYSKSAKKRKTVSDTVNDADENEFNTIDNSLKTNLKNKKKDNEEKK